MKTTTRVGDKIMLFPLCLFLIALTCCDSNEWNGIIPLKSTRTDVEKILGKPMYGSTGLYAAGYKTKTEKVNISYSTGPCKINSVGGWDVPVLTVTSISVYPGVPPKFTDLKLDEGKFKKYPDPGILYQHFYTNEKDGISFTVDGDGEVVGIRYFPGSKNYRLKCDKDD